ncbi:hypothetical protein KAR91_58610 [Candidatus Pacearchaeota archaeon]|nr:hypothetical protein [Candidatus Pacearchaeota archaeon]
MPKKRPTAHNYLRDKAGLTAAGTASVTFTRPPRNVPVDIHSITLYSNTDVPFPDANAVLGVSINTRPRFSAVFGHVTIPNPQKGFTWKPCGGVQDWELNNELWIWMTSCRACVIQFIVEWSYRE